jgi:hypothetical protein
LIKLSHENDELFKELEFWKSVALEQGVLKTPTKNIYETQRCCTNESEYSVHFEVEAQAQEKKIKEQLMALGWIAPRHLQVNSNNEGRSMSINEATPEMWNDLRKKYKALAEEELKDDDRQEYLEYPSVDDPVESPVHYNTGSVECIEAIKASMSDTEFKGYLKGNAMKYLWRYDYKGKPVEDLKKAQWYLARLTEEVE